MGVATPINIAIDVCEGKVQKVCTDREGMEVNIFVQGILNTHNTIYQKFIPEVDTQAIRRVKVALAPLILKVVPIGDSFYANPKCREVKYTEICNTESGGVIRTKYKTQKDLEVVALDAIDEGWVSKQYDSHVFNVNRNGDNGPVIMMMTSAKNSELETIVIPPNSSVKLSPAGEQLVQQTHKSVSKLQKLVSDMPCTQRTFLHALAQCIDHNGEAKTLDVYDLAKRYGILPSATTGTMHLLANKGILTAERNELDEKIIQITPLGEEVASVLSGLPLKPGIEGGPVASLTDDQQTLLCLIIGACKIKNRGSIHEFHVPVGAKKSGLTKKTIPFLLSDIVSKGFLHRTEYRFITPTEKGYAAYDYLQGLGSAIPQQAEIAA